jgi:hypothetical protein
MAPSNGSRRVNTQSTFTTMASEADFTELVGLGPDERLLGADLVKLPPSVGRPQELEPSPARKRVVAIGAALTGITLVLGIVLAAFGAVDGFASGFDATSIAALLLGIALISTHWGWVHVAELTGQRLEQRGNRPALENRRSWLDAIEPYPRWEVTASTDQDGSISIVTTRYRPVAAGEREFTFVKEQVGRETHSGDEPAAAVAERAELLRRRAAQDTELARQHYEVAHDAYQRAALAHADEQERLAAVRAASEALSDQINTNLRNPPLAE